MQPLKSECHENKVNNAGYLPDYCRPDFVFLTSWAKWIILGLLIIAAVVYFGEDKCLEVVRGIFRRGKQAVEDIPSKNVDEELTVRDVICNSIEGGKFQLEVVTEKGLMKLRPQPFNVIPEVLQKGKKSDTG